MFPEQPHSEANIPDAMDNIGNKRFESLIGVL